MKVKMNFFALTVLVATAVIGHCAENAPAVDGAAALTEVQTKNALTNGPKSQIDIKDEAALVKSTRVALNYVREALAAAPGVIAKTHPPENRTATQENPVVVSLQTALNATQAALEAAQKAEQTKPGHIVAPGAPAQPGAPKESVFTGISEQLKTARESALAARTATLKQIKERSGGSEEVNAKENTTQYDLAIESSRQNIFVDQIQLAQDALYSASLIAQIRHHRFIGGEANNRNADFLVVVLENTWWAQDANERAKLQSEERVAFYAKAKELDKQIQQSNARMKDQDAAVKKALDESTKLLEQRKAEKKNGDKNPKEMRQQLPSVVPQSGFRVLDKTGILLAISSRNRSASGILDCDALLDEIAEAQDAVNQAVAARNTALATRDQKQTAYAQAQQEFQTATNEFSAARQATQNARDDVQAKLLAVQQAAAATSTALQAAMNAEFDPNVTCEQKRDLLRALAAAQRTETEKREALMFAQNVLENKLQDEIAKQFAVLNKWQAVQTAQSALSAAQSALDAAETDLTTKTAALASLQQLYNSRCVTIA